MALRRVLRLTALWLVGSSIVASAAWASPSPASIVFDRTGDLYAIRLGHGVSQLTSTLSRKHAPVWSPHHQGSAFAVGKRADGGLNDATTQREVIDSLPDRILVVGFEGW